MQAAREGAKQSTTTSTPSKRTSPARIRDGLEAAASSLRPIIAEFIDITSGRAELDNVVAQLRTEMASIAVTAPLGLLDVTARVLTQSDGRGSDSGVEKLLLGEDWFDHESPSSGHQRRRGPRRSADNAMSAMQPPCAAPSTRHSSTRRAPPSTSGHSTSLKPRNSMTP